MIGCTYLRRIPKPSPVVMRKLSGRYGGPLLFLVLNIVDLLFTRFLLDRSNGSVYEGNPVAGWWLAKYGWPGLAAFKSICVVLFTSAWFTVQGFCPRTARRLAWFGCFVLLGVVGYSTALLTLPCSGYRQHAAWAEDAVRLSQELSQDRDRLLDYQNLLRVLIEDLVAGRLSLQEATSRLANSAKSKDPKWQRTLRAQYGVASDDACLAVNLITNTVCSRLKAAPREAEQLAERLEAEYCSTFGKQAPRIYQRYMGRSFRRYPS